MRQLEIRRHSIRSGQGFMLNQRGVALARRIGDSMGVFARVYASPAERAIHRLRRRGHLAEVAARDRPAQLGARFSHIREYLRLLLGKSLHDLDKVRNEVRTPLELHADLLLGLIGPFVERLDLIVATSGKCRGQRQEERGEAQPLKSHVCVSHERVRVLSIIYS